MQAAGANLPYKHRETQQQSRAKPLTLNNSQRQQRDVRMPDGQYAPLVATEEGNRGDLVFNEETSKRQKFRSFHDNVVAMQ